MPHSIMYLPKEGSKTDPIAGFGPGTPMLNNEFCYLSIKNTSSVISNDWGKAELFSIKDWRVEWLDSQGGKKKTEFKPHRT